MEIFTNALFGAFMIFLMQLGVSFYSSFINCSLSQACQLFILSVNYAASSAFLLGTYTHIPMSYVHTHNHLKIPKMTPAGYMKTFEAVFA
jgi:hypothetical protein